MMIGERDGLQRETPEVDERAVTKYGSQRLVNNGALRRRGIVDNGVVVDDDDDENDETTFCGSLRTLDPVIASHDNRTTDTVSPGSPDIFGFIIYLRRFVVMLIVLPEQGENR